MQQRCTHPLPHRIEPRADRRVGEQLVLQGADFTLHRRIVEQIAGERFQPFFELVAERMLRIDDGFGEELVEPVEHSIGETFIEPGPAHDAAGVLVDDLITR